METTKSSVITTHSNSSGKELLRYYEFSKKMNKLNSALRILDDYKFPLNKKAVKEVSNYYENNLINSKNDKKYTKEYINDFKTLSSKLDYKYGTTSEMNSYNRVHILRSLACKSLNIRGEDLNRLTSMFKDKNTLTLNYDKLSVRLLAYYSKDKKLNELLERCDEYDEDFYSHLATIIFNDKYENCTDVRFYNYYGKDEKSSKSVCLSNNEGKDRKNIARQVILYEIYGAVPDAHYKESFLNYVDIFENYFCELKCWVDKMLKYDKPYIQDVFGNVFVFENSYITNRTPHSNICALINLTESSIHKLFLLELLTCDWINVRLPLQNCFIVDFNREDDLSHCSISYKIFSKFDGLFKKYNLKLDIQK